MNKIQVTAGWEGEFRPLPTIQQVPVQTCAHPRPGNIRQKCVKRRQQMINSLCWQKIHHVFFRNRITFF